MAQSSGSNDLTSSNAASIFRDLPVGAKIKLVNGAIAEITGNPRDGAWLMIQFIEHPENPSLVGQEDMVFFVDVEGVV